MGIIPILFRYMRHFRQPPSDGRLRDFRMFLRLESVPFLTQWGGRRTKDAGITCFNRKTYRSNGLEFRVQGLSPIPDAPTLVMLGGGDLGTMVMARQIIIATPPEVQ